MKVLAGVAALLCVLVVVAAGGSTRHMSGSLRQRIVTDARKLAYAMGDSLPVKTAQVYGPASYERALAAWGGGVTSPNVRKGRYYVIVVRGRFNCAGPFRRSLGSVATRLWSPTTGNNGTGLGYKLPASTSRLGHPTLISLR